MVDFDQDFFDSNKIVLETLDDIGEYLTTVDVWLTMNEQSEKDVLGSEKFGFYSLHTFDQPVEIVTADGNVLDSFQGAVVYDSPGKLSERETYSFTFQTPEEAQVFFENLKEEFYQFGITEDGEDMVDLGELKVGDQ